MALVLGGLLLVLTVLFALHALGSPGCSIDPEETDARIVLGVGVVGWVLGAVGCVVVVARMMRRMPPTWVRAAVAIALPVGLVVLWVAVSGALTIGLDAVDASGASSACW